MTDISLYSEIKYHFLDEDIELVDLGERDDGYKLGDEPGHSSFWDDPKESVYTLLATIAFWAVLLHPLAF